ncbi:MAG: hypothetical protein KR126chlam2_01194 [Chlamydiae bacterium]|nr:hypothetical protein [Chlamydiota bacterium]
MSCQSVLREELFGKAAISAEGLISVSFAPEIPGGIDVEKANLVALAVVMAERLENSEESVRIAEENKARFQAIFQERTCASIELPCVGKSLPCSSSVLDPSSMPDVRSAADSQLSPTAMRQELLPQGGRRSSFADTNLDQREEYEYMQLYHQIEEAMTQISTNLQVSEKLAQDVVALLKQKYRVHKGAARRTCFAVIIILFVALMIVVLSITLFVVVL